jgi:hypothetical protein
MLALLRDKPSAPALRNRSNTARWKRNSAG